MEITHMDNDIDMQEIAELAKEHAAQKISFIIHKSHVEKDRLESHSDELDKWTKVYRAAEIGQTYKPPRD
jgi:hypothetical protein